MTIISSFKPMLLSNNEFNITVLDYTLMFKSKKRDGVRIEVTNQGLWGRSLKRIPNEKLQEWFKPVYEDLPDGVILEAEVYSHGLLCGDIAGICGNKKQTKTIPENMKLYIFGIYDAEKTFEERIKCIEATKHF